MNAGLLTPLGFMGRFNLHSLNPESITEEQSKLRPILLIHGNYHHQGGWLPFAHTLEKGNNKRPVYTVNLPAEQQANAILQGVRRHVGPDRVPCEDVTVFVTEFAEDAVTAASDSMKARLQTYDRVAGAVPDSSVFLG